MAETQPKFESLDKEIQATESLGKSYQDVSKSIASAFDTSQLGGMLLKGGEIISHEFNQFQHALNNRDAKVKQEVQQAIDTHAEDLSRNLELVRSGLAEGSTPEKPIPDGLDEHTRMAKTELLYQKYNAQVKTQFDKYNSDFLSKLSGDKDLHKEHLLYQIKANDHKLHTLANKIYFEQKSAMEMAETFTISQKILDASSNPDHNKYAMYDEPKKAEIKDQISKMMMQIGFLHSKASTGDYYASPMERSKGATRDAANILDYTIKRSQNPQLIFNSLKQKDPETGQPLLMKQLGINEKDYEALIEHTGQLATEQTRQKIHFAIAKAQADNAYATRSYTDKATGKIITQKHLIVTDPQTGLQLTNQQIADYENMDHGNTGQQKESLLLHDKFTIDKGNGGSQNNLGTIHDDPNLIRMEAERDAAKNGRSVQQELDERKKNGQSITPDPSNGVKVATQLDYAGTDGSLARQIDYAQQNGLTNVGQLSQGQQDLSHQLIGNNQDAVKLAMGVYKVGQGIADDDDVAYYNRWSQQVTNKNSADQAKDPALNPAARAQVIQSIVTNPKLPSATKGILIGMTNGWTVSDKVLNSINGNQNLSVEDVKRIDKETGVMEKKLSPSPFSTEYHNSPHAILLASGMPEWQATLVIKGIARYSAEQHILGGWGISKETAIRDVFSNFSITGSNQGNMNVTVDTLNNSKSLITWGDVVKQTNIGQQMKEQGKTVADIARQVSHNFRQMQQEIIKSPEMKFLDENQNVLQNTIITKDSSGRPGYFVLKQPDRAKPTQLNSFSPRGKQVKLILPTNADGSVVVDVFKPRGEGQLGEKLSTIEEGDTIYFVYPSSVQGLNVPYKLGQMYRKSSKKKIKSTMVND